MQRQDRALRKTKKYNMKTSALFLLLGLAANGVAEIANEGLPENSTARSYGTGWTCNAGLPGVR